MDAYTPGLHMGNCGEDTASTMSISRAAQDAYTVQSYQRAAAAYQVRGEVCAGILQHLNFEVTPRVTCYITCNVLHHV